MQFDLKFWTFLDFMELRTRQARHYPDYSAPPVNPSRSYSITYGSSDETIQDTMDDDAPKKTKWTLGFIFRKVTFYLIFAACLAGAAYQSGMLLDIYFRYPTSVTVGIKSKPKIELPGITFCSSVEVKRSGLKAVQGSFETTQEKKVGLNKLPGFNESISEKKEVTGTKTKGGQEKTTSDEQEVLEKSYYEFFEKIPVDRMIEEGLKFTDFIIVPKTKCALDEVKPDENTNKANILCRDKLPDDFVESFQGQSVCYTLNHESLENNALTKVIVPAGETQSPVFIGDVDKIEEEDRKHKKNTMFKNKSYDGEHAEGDEESEDQPIQPLEVIRFVIDFNNNESVKMDEPAVGTVSVHDSDMIRLGRLQSTKLQKGHYYEIFIEGQVSNVLQYPYDPGCYPYAEMRTQAMEARKEHWKKLDKPQLPGHPLLLGPLSYNDCLYGCLGNETVLKCGCWPPEIPFVKTKGYDTGYSTFINETTKFCSWYKRGQRQQEAEMMSAEDLAMKVFYSCLASNEIVNKCKKRCHEGCQRKRVKSSSQSREWPSKERIEYAKDKTLLEKYKKCCAVVSIRMASSEYTIYNYSPKYDPIEFVSYIGGIVSLWLGFTFIGIFDYAEAIVNLVKSKVKGRSGRKSLRGNQRALQERPPFLLQQQETSVFPSSIFPTTVSHDMNHYHATKYVPTFEPKTGRFDFVLSKNAKPSTERRRSKKMSDCDQRELEYYRGMFCQRMKVYW